MYARRCGCAAGRLAGDLPTVEVRMVQERPDDWMWAGLDISAINRQLRSRGLELRKLQGRPVLCPIGAPDGWCLYYFASAAQLVGYFDDPSLFAQESSDYTVSRTSWDVTPAEERAMQDAMPPVGVSMDGPAPEVQGPGGPPIEAGLGSEMLNWLLGIALSAALVSRVR